MALPVAFNSLEFPTDSVATYASDDSDQYA